MEGTGTLTVRVITSRAQLPVEGATVVVTQKGKGGKYQLLSVQATDRSGTAAEPQSPSPSRRRPWGRAPTRAAPPLPTPCATCGRSIRATPCCW